MSESIVFDLVLCAGLLWSASGALLSRSRYSAVILFIVFGLLMTVAWVRVAAPDIALAEAAIGAGLTGALLLEALSDGSGETTERAGRVWLLPLATFVAALLGLTLTTLPSPEISLPAVVDSALPESGVMHPVTAVLLNFRGYDTLLEVAVLLAALLGVLSVMQPQQTVRLAGVPFLQAIARIVVPFAILTAGYLLWVGAHRPGGAFQGAAILAAAAVLLALVGMLDSWTRPPWSVRLVIALGPLVFLTVAAPVFERAVLLYLPPDYAGLLILLIESALTVSLGFTLAGLFLVQLRSERADGR